MSTGRRSEGSLPAGPPTRKTLVFPAVELPRSRRPPPLRPAAPSARPSERPTLKTLPRAFDAAAGTSNTEVIELSASALESDPSFDDLHTRALRELAGPGSRSKRWRARAGGVAEAIGELPRSLFGLVVARTALAYAGLAAVGVVVAVSVTPGGSASVTERVTGVSEGLRGPARAPREASSQRTPLALRPAIPDVVPPAGGCAMAGASRVLAMHAHLPPGLDVNVTTHGFGVGFASSPDEALGMRLDGSPLRVAESLRVRAGSAVRHVAVEGGHRDDDAIDLRVDGDDARTVGHEGDTAALRVQVVGGWIQVVRGGRSTGYARALWPVPGGRGNASANANANASAGVGAKVGVAAGAGGGGKAKAAPSKMAAAFGGRVADGFLRLGSGPPTVERSSVVSLPAPDVRAAARDDGGVVIALRRPSALWLGLVDAHLAAAGPLVALTRPGALLGMPSVAQSAAGGAVAWAERPAGDRDWIVMIASFGAQESAHEPPTLRPIAAGMSPSLSMLPGGELLLVYAVGASGSHRVVAQRLGRDLEPRGEPVVVSPDDLNAGQPAAAVGADGRGLVAFFGAERGHAARVLATPLACDPGQ